MATGNGKCYTTFEEVVADVDRWFSKQLKTKTLAQALCYYNLGKAIDDCHYYETKYLQW